MVVNNLTEIQDSIKLHEHILDCLNVRLFYLNNKTYQNEQEDNDNKLNVIKTSYQIEQQQKKLNKLIGELNLSFQLLNE